jgi:hypothetical protein
LGLFFIYMASFYKRFYNPNYFIYLLFVFLGGLVPLFWVQQYFSFGLIVPKKYIQCSLGSSVCKISSVLGPTVAGFLSIGWCSWVYVHRFGMFLFLLL